MHKRTLTTRADVEFLVNQFYAVARQDAEIGDLFRMIADEQWPQHLQTIYRFWASLLLGEKSYYGNPKQVHWDLLQKQAMTEAHFERWLAIWTATVEQYFTGERADEAIFRAKTIKTIMVKRLFYKQNGDLLSS
ncbi:MAG: group III truncated hemoglobin [Acinetobacter sp.]|nr:group III truncated hemoglobin [Acinetobacter sp.]